MTHTQMVAQIAATLLGENRKGSNHTDNDIKNAVTLARKIMTEAHNQAGEG